MKYFKIIILILFAGLFINACSKSAASPKETDKPIQAILGKWNLVNDSIFSAIGPSNENITNYRGKPGDYFDFRMDGNLYIKEDTTLDTLGYKIVSDSSIVISSFGWVFNGVSTASNVTTITDHQATLYAPNEINPGGIYDRTVNLSR